MNFLQELQYLFRIEWLDSMPRAHFETSSSLETLNLFDSIRIGFGLVRFGFDVVHQNRIMQCAVHSVDFDVKCETDFIIFSATYNTQQSD